MTGEDLALAASFVASIAFFVVGAVVAVTHRPPSPPSLPATSDVGPETPAVANLLANGGRVTPDAVPATLLDLAARRVVRIEETAPETYVCRVGNERPPGLAGYESRVLELLRSKAEGGIVPAQALTTGPSSQAHAWERAFRSEVITEASRAGLCTRRWPASALSLLGFLAFGAFVGAAMGLDAESETATWQQWVVLGFALLTVVALTYVFRDDAQMVTPAGLAEQGRWLALRRFLHEDELFGGLPPTAVAVRERYLAYGAALGAAAAAVRAVPMGAESDRWAWSHYGGRWHQVQVTYPRVWPPGWGLTPGGAAWLGVRFLAFGIAVLWIASQLLPRIEVGPNSDQLTRDFNLALMIGTLVAFGAVAVGLWLALTAVIALVGTREVTGEAIRLRQFGGEDAVRCYLAVDTGAETHVRAWVVSPQIYAGLNEYEAVTVSVAPLIGRVRSVRRVGGSAAAKPEAASAPQ